MADISKTKSHSMDPEELRGRLEKLADEMTRKFGIKARWDEDTCHLSGPALKKGMLTMSPSEVTIELTLGMMAKMLKGRIEKEIDSRMSALIS